MEQKLECSSQTNNLIMLAYHQGYEVYFIFGIIKRAYKLTLYIQQQQ